MQVNYLDVPREWLSQETIDEANRMKAQSQEEYEYHWLGRPRNVGALVCPTFNKQIHVRTFPMEILKEANFFHGQDPHLHYYPANVWVARIPKGEGLFDYWVYNEWPMRSTFGGKFYYELRKEKKCTLSLKARSSIFRVMDNTTNKTHGWVRIRARGLDTRFAKGSGGESHTTNTRGIIQEMADVENGGLVFTTPAESNIDGARNQIRQLLEYDPLQEISQFNEPSLYVAPWCENMLNSLQFHCFNRENKETEDETRKDFWDALKIAMATAKTTSHEVFFDKDKKIDFPEEDNMTKLQDMFMHKQTRRQLVCA
jgi:hypothetical protein